MKRILIIGRFQPLQLGHLSLMKEALQHCDELIIGIGSAENSFEDINPFTCSERTEMIINTIKEEGLPLDRIHIIPVRDINDDTKWVRHVQSLCPHFDEVYTGKNPGYLYIKKLFEEKSIPVHVFENILPIEASAIRKAIKDHENWEQYLPKAVAEYIKAIHGDERIRSIEKTGIKKT